MENEELYNLLEDGEINLPSEMALVFRKNSNPISYEDVVSKLKENNTFDNVMLQVDENGIQGTISVDDVEYDIRIMLGASIDDMIDLEALTVMNRITEEEIEEIKESNMNVYTSMKFNEVSDKSYLVQLKIMAAISDDYVALVDLSACKIISGKWVRMTIETDVEPLTKYLYTIHGVYDEKKGKRSYWMHTHGLHRCGCVELEVLNIDDLATEHQSALNTFAARFVEEGMIKRGEEISIGYAGDMYLGYTWYPWEQALDMMSKKKSIFSRKKNFLGDIQDRDEFHSQPSGILFACNEGNIAEVTVFNELLVNNPIFFLTNRETYKMSMIAKKRFNYFSELFNKYKNDEENWRFLFKAGIPTNLDNDDIDAEHLWFILEGIKDNNLIGRLINEPYHIADMKVEEIYEVSIDKLTDWLIQSTKGEFSPDTIYSCIDQ
ncbi:hypothetical protein SAMN02745163_02420 [Clostridium cavendishii DSM 21758]|uniref:Uncharacterized protein n=1 Tax=Clostridium cavendishii DSM 21758 TaxID=1121302 RepID=A0A1M6LLF0_9CLOT|nr:DUF4026 domain-containing protein [Clostridium cavendishii]SHJ72036.1 hypothetical protein SAMN02745163_02420 [Clostridium cavendishii DSM 21758]